MCKEYPIRQFVASLFSSQARGLAREVYNCWEIIFEEIQITEVA